MINFNNIKKIYFIGIGGISMSGLACAFKQLGYIITGSDRVKSDVCKELENKGIIVFYEQDGENINNQDLVVYTGAVHNDNKDYLKAKELNIPLVERSEFLGAFASLFSKVYVIAGTHGKTTTSAMLANILIHAKLNPSIHIGGVSRNLKSSYKTGDNNNFVVEGCEYRNSFSYLFGDSHAILNIECDHMDFYKSKIDVENAFIEYANHSKKYVFITTDDSIINRINKDKIVIQVGLKKGDFYAKNIEITEFGYKFDVYNNNMYLCNFKINMMGIHNVLNALFAIAIAFVNKISITAIYNGIKTFQGVERRYENIGILNNIPVICDYAHHPSEIKTSISGIKCVYENVICVFQPHTYSRTKTLLNDFISSFNGVYKLIIYKTFPAREEFDKDGDAIKLFDNLKLSKRKKCYVSNEIDLKNKLIELTKLKTKNKKVILVLGAGDIYNITKKIIKMR